MPPPPLLIIVGANFAITRPLFQLSGGFDENIGMNGRAYPQMCNDEAELVEALNSIDELAARAPIGRFASSELVEGLRQFIFANK